MLYNCTVIERKLKKNNKQISVKLTSGFIHFFSNKENSTQQNDMLIASFFFSRNVLNQFLFNSSSRFFAKANLQVRLYVYMADMKYSSSEQNVVIISQMKAIRHIIYRFLRYAKATETDIVSLNK